MLVLEGVQCVVKSGTTTKCGSIVWKAISAACPQSGSVDVFTSVAFAGNPLAVVFGAEHLSAKDRQAIARETNLSETVFINPPTRQYLSIQLSGML